MKNEMRRQFGVTVKAAGGENSRAFDVIASTEDVDSYDEIVAQDWDLRRFTKNPVVLYYHNMCGIFGEAEDTLPVGFATNVGVIDGKLKATINFVDEKANPMAELCYQGFKQGSLRAVSVGFNYQNARFETRNGQDVYVLSGNELTEISVCPVPANPAAVAEERAKASAQLRAVASGQPSPPSAAPETSMKNLLKALGLQDNATEADALTALTLVQSSAKALEGRLLDATGAKAVDEAFGIIKAGSEAVAQVVTLTAESAAKSVEIEKRDRASLIAEGKAAKKLTPGLEAWAGQVPIETLKSFLESAPAHPALVNNAKAQSAQPGNQEAPVISAFKSWEDMTIVEKHDMYAASKETYDACKADWVRRGSPAIKAPPAK